VSIQSGTKNNYDSTAIQHVLELDGIRGLAISLVLLYHLTASFKMGWCGVDLFFVLSGFLITNILLRTKNSQSYFCSFYARRTLRIFPLYFFVLFLAFWILIPVAQHFGKAPQSLDAGHLWYWFYISNWWNGTGHEIDWLSHFWSLAVEEQFYRMRQTNTCLRTRAV
jgi:peptidoglycan/LPS O-acetylase OafA/YrhL